MQKQYTSRLITKFIEYGLYLLVFFLPWQTRLILRPGSLNGGYFEYGTLSVYAVDLLLFFLILAFGVFKVMVRYSMDVHGTMSPTPPPHPPTPIRGRGETEKDCSSLASLDKRLHGGGIMVLKYFWFWIVIFDLSLSVSVFRTGDLLIALQKYAWLLLGVGLFWIVTQAIYSRKKLIGFFLVGAFIQAGLGICQFIYQRTWSFSWLGLASHEASDLGVSVIEVSGRWLRGYGGFDHPNIFGGFLAVAILLFLITILGGGDLKKKWSVFLVSLSGYLVLVLALFFSFSRAAWIALAAGFGFLLLIAWTGKDRAGIKKIVLGSLIAGLIILPSAFSSSELLFARLEANGRLENKSIAERQASIAEAVRAIRGNWLWGVGLGNYERYVAEKISPGLPSYAYQPVHNLYLLIWAETGILGLIAWLGLIFSLIYDLFVGKSGAKFNRVYYLSLVAALLVLGLFDHWLWSLHFGVLFFWLVLGLASPNKSLVISKKMI